MDILAELSDLLYQDISDLRDKSPQYRELTRVENSLLAKIEAQAGEDLKTKLLDVQGERAALDYLSCFLHGLRLGVQLLGLQGG